MHRNLHVPQWFGAGIGNEFFPFAKAELAASHCGGKVYYPLQLDFVRRRSYFLPQSVKSLPSLSRLVSATCYYTAEEYAKDVQATGTLDYPVNVQRFIERLPCGRKIIVHGGMAGGFAAISKARSIIKEYLRGYANSGRIVAQEIAARNPSKITVGLHIRRGDFHNLPVNKQKSKKSDSRERCLSLGKIFRICFGYNQINRCTSGIQTAKADECSSAWNARVPIEWFAQIGGMLKETFPGDIQFVVVSDGLTPEEKKLLFSALDKASIAWGRPSTPHADLLRLASCDLQICSTSSFSMWSAFLGKTPHIFYREHLNGAESDTPYFWSRPSDEACAAGGQGPWLGYAIGNSERSLPHSLQKLLTKKIKYFKALHNSPLLGGVFRIR